MTMMAMATVTVQLHCFARGTQVMGNGHPIKEVQLGGRVLIGYRYKVDTNAQGGGQGGAQVLNRYWTSTEWVHPLSIPARGVREGLEGSRCTVPLFKKKGPSDRGIIIHGQLHSQPECEINSMRRSKKRRDSIRYICNECPCPRPCPCIYTKGPEHRSRNSKAPSSISTEYMLSCFA